VAAVNRSRLAEAAEASRHLESIQRSVSASLREAARSYSVPLTPPQLRALEILVEALRATGEGLSLKELSGRMGLAHSTVSGVVDRLEARELVRRTPGRGDRRYVAVELTEAVKDWLREELPSTRLKPLADALAAATRAERAAILEGLATLDRLLGGDR
jgi:DNA-binding MarR family transcriptional regulator